MSEEVTVTINGQVLTPGQVLTVRVSLSAFASTLESIGLGDDEQGAGLAESYLENIRSTLDLMGPP